MHKSYLMVVILLLLIYTSITTANATAVTINPIQVCNDAGSNCAPVNFNKSYTDKIFTQSGTTLTYGSIQQINSSKYLNSTAAEASELISSSTLFGSTGRKLFAYDAWFINLIDGNPGFRGLGALGGDGVVISSSARVDTFAHELGHNFGISHTDPKIVDADRFLLADGNTRTTPSSTADIAPDGRQLSRFDPILPEVTVDMIGATPFNSNNFFDLKFTAGAAIDLGLSSLKVNLGPANAFFDITNAPPGTAGSPFGFGALNGINSSDITVSGLSDGNQMLELSFANDSFTSGDSLSFGLDIDLFSNIDGFGATADELRASIATLTFENGYSTSGDLSSLIFSSVFDPNRNVDRISPLRGDPIVIAQVPLPSSIFLLGIAIFALVFVRNRRGRKSIGDFLLHATHCFGFYMQKRCYRNLL